MGLPGGFDVPTFSGTPAHTPTAMHELYITEVYSFFFLLSDVLALSVGSRKRTAATAFSTCVKGSLVLLKNMMT